MFKMIASLILSFLFICPSIAAEIDFHELEDHEWIKMESTNFSVLSNASYRKTQSMLIELENFNYFFQLLMGHEKKTLAEKVSVILANDNSAFYAMGMNRNTAGIYSNQGNVFFASINKFRPSTSGKGNEGRTILLHELVHKLTIDADFKIASPPWFNEGVAEYFSTYIRKDDEIIIGDMSILQYRMNSLRRNGSRKTQKIDSEKIFNVKQQQINLQNANTTQNTFISEFYAHSASLLHYFNADPKRRQQMYTFLHILHRGFSIEESFAYVFKMSFADLDEQVYEYINGRFVMARMFDVGEGGIVFPDTPVQQVDFSKRQALTFLYDKISVLGSSVLTQESVTQMNNDIVEIYPDFFGG